MTTAVQRLHQTIWNNLATAGYATLAAGALCGITLAPLRAWYLWPIGFGIFAYILRQYQGNVVHGFWLGWFFGFGYHLASLYWVSFSLAVGGWWFFIPFPLFGIPIALATLSGAAAALLCWRPVAPLAWPMVVGLVYAAMFFVQGNLWGGLPWNLPAYAVDQHLAQHVSWMGSYGLSLIILVWAASYSLVHRRLWVISTAFMIGLWSLGLWRLHTPQPMQPLLYKDRPVRVRLVQPSIPQEDKWDKTQADQHFQKHITLSKQGTKPDPLLVIWGEAAVPFYLERDPGALAEFIKAAPKDGYAITGLPRLYKAPGAAQPTVWTGIIAYDDKGRYHNSYNKVHLVPFGEYMPLKKWLRLEKLTPGTLDYSPGDGLKTIRLDGVPAFSPLICFEVVFPHAVVPNKKHQARAEWMLALSNDGWFGTSAGPYQHLEICTFRTIEEGIPMIRVANSGISAIIDAYGRVQRRLDLGVVGTLDGELPARLLVPTVASVFGIKVFFMLWLGMAMVALMIQARARSLWERKR